ncbi:hypothetical protein QJS10_CPB15g01349 [Acorus calamus]|uniref:Disease resistance RPP13-like protein 4 n=1 Tax=Acorus calamus TaxID=4465 RepID=A0AAV9D7E2_ACOCL|nr:hypothetical protein QJS10_CPB15g01349 [Acorus calamus]
MAKWASSNSILYDLIRALKTPIIWILCGFIYPENAIINKRQIIYRWIGEGLVEAYDPSRDREEIAEDLFKELIRQGLIEPIKKRGAVYHNPVVKSCRMHPTIHQHVTAYAEQQRYFDFHSCQVKNNNNKGGHSNQAELKTLFNLNDRYLKLDKRWFSVKEKLRVLQLGRWKRGAEHHIELIGDTGLMEELGQLKNLRCLSFKGVSSITKLPDCLGELVKLIILDLRACHNLESLTTKIALLKKLTHLDVSECYLLDNIPEELAQLSELQVLKGFILSHTQGTKRSCKLSDLGKLKKLRKLSINITTKVNEWPSHGEELRQLSSLRSLTITWARLPSKEKEEKVSDEEKKVSDDSTMVSCPSPIQNLEKLDLRCLPTENPPQWLKPNTLGGLKKQYIRGGQLKRLPFEPGTLWEKVEVLRLKCLKKLEEDIDLFEPRNVFPKLIYLEDFQCGTVGLPSSSKDGVWVWEG